MASLITELFVRPQEGLEVIWSGEGVVVRLVDAQWTLLGEKAMHRIKLIHSLTKNKFMLLSDLAPNNVLVER